MVCSLSRIWFLAAPKASHRNQICQTCLYRNKLGFFSWYYHFVISGCFFLHHLVTILKGKLGVNTENAFEEVHLGRLNHSFRLFFLMISWWYEKIFYFWVLHFSFITVDILLYITRKSDLPPLGDSIDDLVVFLTHYAAGTIFQWGCKYGSAIFVVAYEYVSFSSSW